MKIFNEKFAVFLNFKNLLDFWRKSGEIFRKISYMHLYGVGGGAPEASEFIKILEEKSMKTFCFQEKFHKNDTFFPFRSKFK